MKLDTQYMRYLTPEDWRALTAVESLSRKDHLLCPTSKIGEESKLGGGVHRSISALAKVGLIGRLKNAHYDGYRLTYGGLVRLSHVEFSDPLNSSLSDLGISLPTNWISRITSH